MAARINLGRILLYDSAAGDGAGIEGWNGYGER